MNYFITGLFFLGVALYGAAFILYAAALAVLPLNIAHPILTTGAVAVVAILSVVVFNEFLLDIYSGCYLSDSGCVFDYSKSIKLRKCNNG